MESSPPILFDRGLLRKRRNRWAAHFPNHDFLHREAADRVAESFAFITRPFPVMVELGVQTDALRRQLANRPGTTHYFTTDAAFATQPNMLADEEWLPFSDASVDAVVSLFSLQWVNDLPGVLAQIHRILKPDGLLLAVLPGAASLQELRAIFAETESSQQDGLTPRIAPFLDVRDGGALLQRAGFALPVADSERITVTYPNLFALMEDLRGSAQSNMLQQRTQHFTSRGFFLEAAKRYQARYGNQDGDIPATVELVTLTGWKPAPNQQQPARRGSGIVSLKTALQ